jgi:hypothetical protein
LSRFRGWALFASTGHDAFEVTFIDEDRARRREPLAACWTEGFERLSPVRTVKTYRGQKSLTHVYWSATTSCSIVCESHLERHHAMLLDFDPAVTGLVGQPFRLFWPGARGRRGHVPDFFARRVDGGGVVMDVRPDDRIEPDDAEAFAATARACEHAGWAFRRVGAIDPILLANVKWLSPAADRCPSSGSLHRTAGAVRRRGTCRRPAGSPASALPLAVAADVARGVGVRTAGPGQRGLHSRGPVTCGA